MKKYSKLLFSVLMCIIIYVIYFVNANHKLTFLSLGDSLALGENAYQDIQYGYSDYVASYLKRNNLLEFYTKSFAKSGARIEDLENAITKNETIEINNKQYFLKTLLRKADIITLSIGANDILSEITQEGMTLSFIDEKKLLTKIDETTKELENVILLLKKYTRAKIFLIGYYNPYRDKEAKVNRLFTYFENNYQEIASKHKLFYIPLKDIFAYHDDYLPNPFNIHPGSKGYSAIANKIIASLEENILNSLAK